jgi:hypothetical protein
MQRETKGAIASLVLALLMVAGAFGLFCLAFLAAVGCSDREVARSCTRAPQIDTTGNTIVCACTCESNPAAQCPMLASDPTRSAIPACWDDSSSSDEGSTT